MSTEPTRLKVSYKQLLIDPARNYARQDLPKVKELAESIKTNGLIYPIVVSNGGPAEHPYVVRGGFRRCAAWEHLGWQNKEIDIIVREYKKGDTASPVFDSLIDNKDREDSSPLDMAETIYQLVNGTYPVGDGEKAVPVDKKEVAERLNMGQGAVNNYLRMFENLDPDVAKKCRKAGAPMRNMVAWAGIVGKGRTEEDKAESKAALQMEAFEEWEEGKKALEEQGRKKKPRKSSKSGGAGGEGEGGGNEGSMVNKTKTTHLEACIQVLQVKLEEASGVGEKAQIQGRIEALRFVTGDLKKLPGVTQKDLDALDVEEEEEEAEEEEEETADE